MARSAPDQSFHTFRRRGFTIVELLVVISIIVMMLAFMLPTFDRAIERVELIECQSQLRQISLGMINYADEYFR